MADAVELRTTSDLFGGEISQVPEIDRETLAAALYAAISGASLEEFVSYFTNHFEAVIDYANLCAGEKTGQRISMLFNPHRLDTGTKRFPISLYAKLKNEGFVKGLARVVLLNKKKGSTKDLLYASIGMGVEGTSFVQEFPPHVARDLALEYDLSANSHILDPCAGWGGRMLGFSVVANRYTCCEPSSRTFRGLQQIRDFIRTFRSSFEATIHNLPYEDAPIPQRQFDFAFTSPPYYDTEWYAPGEATNSGNRYANFDEWCKGFYAPLVHKTMAALKPGAAFVINIGSRLYPMNDRLFAICEGNYAVSKQKGRLSASNGLGKDGEGETFYEVLNPAGTLVIVETRVPAHLTEPDPECAMCGRRLAVCECAASKPSSSEEEAKVDANDAALTKSASTTETATAEEKPTTEQASTPATVSALDFVSSLPTAVAQRPEPVAAPVQLEVTHESQAIALLDRLRKNGHELLETEPGRLFFTNAAQLSVADREAIRSLDPAVKPFLLALAKKPETTAAPAPVISVPILPDLPAPVTVSSTSAIQFADTARHVPVERFEWQGDYAPPEILGKAKDICFNWETNGLRWWAGDKPIAASIYLPDTRQSFYFSWGHAAGNNISEEAFARYAQEQIRDMRLTNANTRFEVHMGRTIGVDFEAQGVWVSDVQHYAALLDDNRKKFGLDTLINDFLLEKPMERLDESRMAEYHAGQAAARSMYNVESVWRLRDVMWPQLDAQDLQRVRELEDRVIYVVCEMEKNGAHIDRERLERWLQRIEVEISDKVWELQKATGMSLNPNAPSDQVRLFEHLNLPITYTQHKKPKPSFTDAVLRRANHPIVEIARRGAKLLDLQSKLQKIHRSLGPGDILRYALHQLKTEKDEDDEDSDNAGTTTGRFSSTEIADDEGVNIQNQFKPEKQRMAFDIKPLENGDEDTSHDDEIYLIRLLYKAPGGKKHLSADAMQIEYRVFASLAKSPKVIAAYKADPLLSFHKYMWRLFVQHKPDLAYWQQKNLNFAKIYGAKGPKLAQMMDYITVQDLAELQAMDWKERNNDPRLASIREIEAIYDRELPEVNKLIKKASHLAQSQCNDYCKQWDWLHRGPQALPHRGYVKTMLGRRGRFPFSQRLHKALNTVIQGGAADIMKQKLVELHDARHETGFLLRWTVHDEVDGDAADETTAAKVAAILDRQSFELNVPILWEVTTADNWGEC